jgi:hypothetical protein
MDPTDLRCALDRTETPRIKIDGAPVAEDCRTSFRGSWSTAFVITVRCAPSFSDDGERHST